ncbi:MAG: hypothetical protein ACI8RZ_001091 [Myxococcota bacterium]|jgi:hypothetical protein
MTRTTSTTSIWISNRSDSEPLFRDHYSETLFRNTVHPLRQDAHEALLGLLDARAYLPVVLQHRPMQLGVFNIAFGNPRLNLRDHPVDPAPRQASLEHAEIAVENLEFLVGVHHGEDTRKPLNLTEC